MRIPIKAIKDIAEKYNLSHVILFAHHPEDKTGHVVTYGKSVDDCSQAADFGNSLKDALGWPKTLHVQPTRVQKLDAELVRLNKILKGFGIDASKSHELVIDTRNTGDPK